MKNETLKNETPADVKPVLADSYFCGVDFGNGKSQAAFIVFKDGSLVWHTRKNVESKTLCMVETNLAQCNVEFTNVLK